jgi:serine O-acetyltransferase
MVASTDGVGWYALVREDLRTHNGELSSPGFQAVAVYRFGRYAHSLTGPVGLVLRRVHRVLYILVRNFYGIDMPAGAVIGRRFYISHPHGVIVNSKAVFGDDCALSHSVTIGIGIRGKDSVPHFGDRVSIGPGAVVVGQVKVGDDVRIGPNTLVTGDVPSGSHVAQKPSRALQLARSTGVAEVT